MISNTPPPAPPATAAMGTPAAAAADPPLPTTGAGDGMIQPLSDATNVAPPTTTDPFCDNTGPAVMAEAVEDSRLAEVPLPCAAAPGQVYHRCAPDAASQAYTQPSDAPAYSTPAPSTVRLVVILGAPGGMADHTVEPSVPLIAATVERLSPATTKMNVGARASALSAIAAMPSSEDAHSRLKVAGVEFVAASGASAWRDPPRAATNIVEFASVPTAIDAEVMRAGGSPATTPDRAVAGAVAGVAHTSAPDCSLTYATERVPSHPPQATATPEGVTATMGGADALQVVATVGQLDVHSGLPVDATSAVAQAGPALGPAPDTSRIVPSGLKIGGPIDAGAIAPVPLLTVAVHFHATPPVTPRMAATPMPPVDNEPEMKRAPPQPRTTLAPPPMVLAAKPEGAALCHVVEPATTSTRITEASDTPITTPPSLLTVIVDGGAGAPLAGTASAVPFTVVKGTSHCTPGAPPTAPEGPASVPMTPECPGVRPAAGHGCGGGGAPATHQSDPGVVAVGVGVCDGVTEREAGDAVTLAEGVTDGELLRLAETVAVDVCDGVAVRDALSESDAVAVIDGGTDPVDVDDAPGDPVLLPLPVSVLDGEDVPVPVLDGEDDGVPVLEGVVAAVGVAVPVFVGVPDLVPAGVAVVDFVVVGVCDPEGVLEAVMEAVGVPEGVGHGVIA